MSPAPIIRTLTLAEAETLVDWARVEGWNPGLADAPALLTADPHGFIGCFVDGQFAAGISAIRYGRDFGFIGLYISHPHFRGQGFGRMVWDAGIAHLEGRTIGLDGVPQQQANYRSMGFETAYETFRWSGRLSASARGQTVAVTHDLIDAIVAYDRHFFPSARRDFLAEWLKPPRIARATVRNGAICGYAVVRKCHDGCKIGPLFAESPADAFELLAACAAETVGEVLHIDVPSPQTEFAAVLEEQAFSKGFTTARMYRGPAPSIDMSSIFGITTLELG